MLQGIQHQQQSCASCVESTTMYIARKIHGVAGAAGGLLCRSGCSCCNSIVPFSDKGCGKGSRRTTFGGVHTCGKHEQPKEAGSDGVGVVVLLLRLRRRRFFFLLCGQYKEAFVTESSRTSKKKEPEIFHIV